MQELLPAQQVIFNQFKNTISEVYARHGFQSIETPTIDRAEILLAKAGGDTEKQIYKVIKTAEASEGADQALRFDHTVPLARYVVEHENDLAFPFRVTQIGRNFRGERAQKGRFREFYQCDLDIIGRGNLPLAYDAEVISTYYDALKTLNLPDAIIRISNRKILSGLLEGLDLVENSIEIFNIIDHAEKVSPEDTRKSLANLGIEEDVANKILSFVLISGNSVEVKIKLEELDIENETFNQGVEELIYILGLLEKQGLKDIAIADMLIVRGLDYYTGTVFEAVLKDYKYIGAIGGGGRYENLTGYFSEQAFPGVGGSIGLSRLFFVLNENNILDSQTKNPVDIAIVDSDMPEMSGMEVAGTLAVEKAQTLIVFVTAHDELVYDSFKYHPFAFVRKKFLEEELRAVLPDCQKEIEGRQRRFIFQNASQTVNLAQSDILYFEGQANYLAIHTKVGLYKMRSTMGAVEEELKDKEFLRIHKGFLINLEHIRILKSEELVLDNDEILPIGKSYSEEAKKNILRYMRR